MPVLSMSNFLLHFADDDNTYHSLLLQELTQIPENFTVGMLPVGLDGGMKWAGPICKDGVLVDYYAMWGPNRTFMMDMAGFAIKLSAEVFPKVSLEFKELCFYHIC